MKSFKKLGVLLIFIMLLSVAALAKNTVIRYDGKNREEVAVKVSNEEFKDANIRIFGGPLSVAKEVEEKISGKTDDKKDKKPSIADNKEDKRKKINDRLDALIEKAEKELAGNYSDKSKEALKNLVKEIKEKKEKYTEKELSEAIGKIKDAMDKLDKVVVFGDEKVKNYLLDLFKKYNGEDCLESDMGEFVLKLSDKSFRKDKADSDIYESEMKLITDLRLIIYNENYEWENLKSIKGIEAAVNVENMTISSNADDSSQSVSDISPIKSLKKLKDLRLATMP